MTEGPRSRLEIDAGAIRGNARRLARVAAPAELWGVVKADGYGHGAVDAARAALAGGAMRVCVATTAEALELRQALGDGIALVVLSPLAPGDEALVDGLE